MLSRDEHDINGEVQAREVEEVFRRTAQVLEIRVGHESIRTTDEHPFWVVDKGWTVARELVTGDHLTSMSGQPVPITEIIDTQEWAEVFNLRVAEFHTYFVGGDEWGFSVWAHNANCVIITEVGGHHSLIDVVTGKTLKTGTQAEVQAFATSGGHTILPGITIPPSASAGSYAPRPQTVSGTFNPESNLPAFGIAPAGAKATSSRQTTGVAVWSDSNGRQAITLTSGARNSTVSEVMAQHRFPVAEPSAIPGLTAQNFNHPEAQMAYFLRQNPSIRKAEMWINNPDGPCGTGLIGSLGCNPNLEKTLLPGQNFTIRWRDLTGQVREKVFVGTVLN